MGRRFQVTLWSVTMCGWLLAACSGGGGSSLGVGVEQPPTPTSAATPTSAPTPTSTPTPTSVPTTPEATPTPTEPTPVEIVGGDHPIQGGIPCVLQLHGNAGSEGIDPSTQFNGPYYAGGAVHLLQPTTPDVRPTSTWWEYDGPIGDYSDTDEHYVRLRDFLTEYVDDYGCGPIFVWGLSAGAMMTAKLYCNGEDFDGRAWAYYIADPPLDEAVLDCSPPGDSEPRTWFVQSDEFIAAASDYAAEPDRACPEDLYCENGRALSPEEYYQNLGMTPLATVPTHIEALLGGMPPEINAWQAMDGWWSEYDPDRF